MKTTYKRYLAGAIAAVGLVSLGVGQTTTDQPDPSQQSTLGQAQTPTNQSGISQPDSAQPGSIQGGATSQPSEATQNNTSTTTDLGVNAGGVPTLNTANAPKIQINHMEVNFTDAQPGMINGQLMVPIRDVAEKVGAKVDWLNDEKKVVIDLPNQQNVTLSTNQEWLAMVNSDYQGSAERINPRVPDTGDLMLSADEVVLIDNRAYMPFDRLVASLNGTGNWDQTAGLATITIDQTNTAQPNTEEDSKVPTGTGNPPDNESTTGQTGSTSGNGDSSSNP